MSMKSMVPAGRLLVLLGVLLALGPAAARAESTRCEYWIASLPYTAGSDQPGTHCLLMDLSWSGEGAAITLKYTRVNLDLDHHQLRRSGDSDDVLGTIGIQCYHCAGIISNGTVTGFDVGVEVVGVPPEDYYRATDEVLIEGLTVSHGVRALIKVAGRGVVVRGNRLLSTAQFYFPYPEGAEPAYGIWLTGWEHRVLDNDLVATSGDSSTAGTFIKTVNAARSVISGNRITDNGSGNKLRQGIVIDGWPPPLHSEDVLVTGNHISGVYRGVRFLQSIPGKYRDNITSGVEEPYFGGTDAGNNN